MTLIQMFKIKSLSILEAWDKLKDYCRKLYAANSNQKDIYRDQDLILILIRALPKDYTATIDTLDAETALSVEEKLKQFQLKLGWQPRPDMRAHLLDPSKVAPRDNQCCTSACL